MSNALTVKYRYKEYGTETWSAYVTISASSINIHGDGTYNSNGAVTLGSNFDYRKSYDLEIVAQDGCGTAILSYVSPMAQVTRGEPVFDWSNTDFRVRETLRTANVEPVGEMSIGTNEKPYSTGYFNQIYIGGNPVSVIEEEGTIGIWYYRKWRSGVAECWGQPSNSVASSGTFLGANAYSTNFALPSGLFVSVDSANANPRVGSSYAIPAYIYTTPTSVGVDALSNESGTKDFSANIFVRGRWK